MFLDVSGMRPDGLSKMRVFFTISTRRNSQALVVFGDSFKLERATSAMPHRFELLQSRVWASRKKERDLLYVILNSTQRRRRGHAFPV